MAETKTGETPGTDQQFGAAMSAGWQALQQNVVQQQFASIVRCSNESDQNQQICADVWRNIPEGSGIGRGMWRALRLYWRQFHGTQPPPGMHELILNWPEDQLRWLRNTMVQYTAGEGGYRRSADILPKNTGPKTAPIPGDETYEWKMDISLRQADGLVLVIVSYPWDDADATPMWQHAPA